MFGALAWHLGTVPYGESCCWGFQLQGWLFIRPLMQGFLSSRRRYTGHLGAVLPASALWFMAKPSSSPQRLEAIHGRSLLCRFGFAPGGGIWGVCGAPGGGAAGVRQLGGRRLGTGPLLAGGHPRRPPRPGESCASDLLPTFAAGWCMPRPHGQELLKLGRCWLAPTECPPGSSRLLVNHCCCSALCSSTHDMNKHQSARVNTYISQTCI